MQRILITGGAGFIGKELCKRIASPIGESSVVVLDNFSASQQGDPLLEIKTGGLQVVRADLVTDVEILNNMVHDCDLVIHVAAQVRVDLGVSDSTADFQNNIIATRNVLEAMKKSKRCKKIVFTSSSTVYGEPSIIPTPESYGPLVPISLYGSSKLACEALISGYCSTFSMSGIILRLANVIGPSSSHGVINDFFTKLLRNPIRLEIRGDGSQRKSYLYIEDCVEAIVRAIHKLEVLGQGSVQLYNVGSKDWVRVTEIAEIIMQSLDLKDVEVVFSNVDGKRGWNGDVREMLLDCSRIMEEGWRADLDSRAAVLRTVLQICHQSIYA